MSASTTIDNLAKLSLEALEEVYEREKNILKNKKIIDKLPDRGKQLEGKLETIEKELQLRKEIKELEDNMDTLTIRTEGVDVLKEKHVQHICSIEKSPSKERYKPFATLTVHNKDPKQKTAVKPTCLISLTESITLLAKEGNKLPVEQIKSKIEGGGQEDENDENNEEEDIENIA